VGQRLRGLILIVVLTSAGVFLGSSLSQWWRGGPSPAPPSALPGAPGRVTVEVLNAGGQAGVAREATRALRDRGFDVVYYGNTESFSQDPSVVLDRTGRGDRARLVAEVLGIPAVRSEPDSSRYLDVTVRLGPEWIRPGEPREERADPAPWWDLRRFLKGPDPSGSINPAGQ
jgi:hypothetical protein